MGEVLYVLIGNNLQDVLSTEEKQSVEFCGNYAPTHVKNISAYVFICA